MTRCWNTLVNGQEMPEFPPKEEKILKKTLFLEAITESLPQFALSNIVLRVYGLSDNLTTMILQYFSLFSSMLSLFLAFIVVRNSAIYFTS